MFGIDFSEILLIFLIALVVLGPQKLPRVAGTVGRWIGRARVMARQFRDQLEVESMNLQRQADAIQRETTSALNTDPVPDPIKTPTPEPSAAPTVTPNPSGPATSVPMTSTTRPPAPHG